MIESLGRVRELERQAASRNAEIAGLKGLRGRPDIKPSGTEQGSKAPPDLPCRPRHGGGKKTALRTIHADRVAKGYQNSVVQELMLRAHVLRLRRECWVTPQGQRITAALPAGIWRHFGPEPRRFAVAEHHQGQITVARLLKLLRGIGIDICNRQVVRLLITGQYGFVDEARDVLRAGLEPARWISADDTGQFDVGARALCWVHAARLVHRLDTFTEVPRAAQQHLRRADLVVPCRPQGVSRGPLAATAKRVARPLRAHLSSTNGVRHARPAGNPAAHQRLGE